MQTSVGDHSGYTCAWLIRAPVWSAENSLRKKWCRKNVLEFRTSRVRAIVRQTEGRQDIISHYVEGRRDSVEAYIDEA